MREPRASFIPAPEFLTLSRDHVPRPPIRSTISYTVPPMEKGPCAGADHRGRETRRRRFIFCNTKSKRALRHGWLLQRFGYDADELSADRSAGRTASGS